MSNQLVWLLCLLVCGLAIKLDSKNFLHVVKRMRWLFISMFIIYAYGTPGEYIQYFPINFAPSIEGCQLGLLQIGKLLIALAGLSILFAGSSKEHLIAGLNLLLAPLRYMGLDIERFSARLLLTFDYVEALAVKGNLTTNFNQLAELETMTETTIAEHVIVLPNHGFKLLDKVIIVIIIFTAIFFMIKLITPMKLLS
jgi:energy-coupling factor transport system permease protein